MVDDRKTHLREIPSISRLLENEAVVSMVERFSREQVVAALRDATDELRDRIRRGEASSFPDSIRVERQLIERAWAILESCEIPFGPRQVINATGVVLHTNLGRAPLAETAVENVKQNAAYCSLEIDLASGKRTKRDLDVAAAIAELTGSEAAFVVNNNAAAVFLMLNTLANGKEVIVSRSELVEIGGSFRLPDIMTASGARLVEVGTTNRTYLSDYEAAISDQTAAILKVHTSNYAIRGYYHAPASGELVALGREKGVPVLFDTGSGAFALPDFLSERQDHHEPRIDREIRVGFDVITFSGDKLFGGPQCGIVAGKARWIQRIRRNPLARAVRIGKLTLAALAATVREWRTGNVKAIPLYRILAENTASVRARCERLLTLLRQRSLTGVEIVACESSVGGGSFADVTLESFGVALSPKGSVSCEEMLRKLRNARPPVIARIEKDRVLFDLRTVFDWQIEKLAEAIAATNGG